MKIAVLAGNDRNLYACALIQKLAQAGYPPSQVVLKNNNLLNRMLRVLKVFSFRDIPAYIGKIRGAVKTDNINYQLEEYMFDNGLHKESIYQLSGRLGFQLIYTDDVNDAAMIRSLEKNRPDLIIYCSGGILRKPLLRVPVIGILNAHMGLLPEFRGMNVLEWSLFYKAPVGVTVHYIDAGIDTGDILLKREMDITQGDTINTLRMRSIVLNVELMAEAVDLISKGRAILHPNPAIEGKQYFVMHDIIRQQVEKELRGMQ